MTKEERGLWQFLKSALPPLIKLPMWVIGTLANLSVANKIDLFALPLSGLCSFNGKTIPAAGILFRKAMAGGLRGKTVILASSGNTGLSFALCKAVFGIARVIVVVKRTTPAGKIAQIELAGAEVELADISTILHAHNLAIQHGYEEINQYTDPGSIGGHMNFTYPHMLSEFTRLGIEASGLCAAAGTTSSLVAGSSFLRPRLPKLTIIGAASMSSEEEIPGSRTLKGLEETGFCYQQHVDELITSVSKRAAFRKSLQLYRGLLPGGPTSGMAIEAICEVISQYHMQERLGDLMNSQGRIVIVSLFMDGPLPYADEYKKILGS